MQGTSGNSSNNNNSTRRRRAITRNGVVVRSVWETRMKMDEVQGGIKVFNAGECDANAADEEGLRVYRRLRRNQSDGAAAAERKKRRSWSTSVAARSRCGSRGRRCRIRRRRRRRRSSVADMRWEG
uniref:Uncharacterized protein n=1 Tax=Ananas comosus var. bracteatus TaxID=296719 RepID=A0A6V7QBH0_ANACO|nr:unnamed protein product [Ananas comosus var. bracteatus]